MDDRLPDDLAERELAWLLDLCVHAEAGRSAQVAHEGPVVPGQALSSCRSTACPSSSRPGTTQRGVGSTIRSTTSPILSSCPGTGSCGASTMTLGRKRAASTLARPSCPASSARAPVVTRCNGPKSTKRPPGWAPDTSVTISWPGTAPDIQSGTSPCSSGSRRCNRAWSGTDRVNRTGRPRCSLRSASACSLPAATRRPCT